MNTKRHRAGADGQARDPRIGKGNVMSRVNDELNETDLVHTAWHEAGHAVVACALGVKQIELSMMDAVVENYRVRGMTNIWSTYSDQCESIPIMLAGFLAERKVNSDRRGALRGAQRDLELVEALNPHREGAEKVRGYRWRKETYGTSHAWRRFVLGQARLTARILSLHDEAVKGLAGVLLERQSLSRLEFRQWSAVFGLCGHRIRTIFLDIARVEAENPRNVDLLSELHEELAILGGPRPFGTEEECIWG